MAVSLWYGMVLFCFISCSQMTGAAKVNVGYSRLNEWRYNSYSFGAGLREHWSVDPVRDEMTTRIESSGSESWFVSEQIKKIHVSKIFYIDIRAKPLCNSECKLSIYIIYGKTSDIPTGGSHNEKKARKRYFDDNGVIAGSATFQTNKTTNQTVQIKNKERKEMFVAIVAKSEAVWRVYGIQMYYYYCEEGSVNQTQLNRLEAPASGNINVTVNCSANAVSSSNNKTSFLARCYANGTWEIDDDAQCKCLEGFESTNTGCSPCPTDYFKPNISNSICAKCPSNANSNNNKTSCECKDGYYRFQNSPILPCYGLVQLNDNPSTNFNNGNITIRWNEASLSNSLKEQILYDVECYSCEKSQCNGSCVGENYDPGQFNLTQRSVVVSNLSSGIYVFRIYPKNSLNNVAGKEKWNFSETDFVNVIKPTPCQKLNTIKTSESDSDYYTTILVVAISIAVVALLLGFLIGTFRERRKKPKNTETTFPVELESMPEGEINENSTCAEAGPPKANDISSILALFQDVQRSDESFWEFPRKRLTMLRKQGEGSFGTVNKAKVTPIHAITSEKGGVVAVKMFKENASLKDKIDFMSELNLMKKLEPHPHVVQLLGCCTNSEPFFLILEYLVGGDLLGYLRKSRGYEDPYNTGEYVPTSRLGEKDLLSFAWMISDGMDYLSSKEIVHRDLAARNVLVGEDNICKVSDFGLAREGSYERKSKARLPAKWMAPEDLLHGQCTSMSDIWSYGILLWEIFTIGDSPYPGFKGRDVFNLIESGYRMPKPSHFSDELYSLMMECWNDEPIKRPKFSYISSFFHKMLDDFTAKAYLDLTKFDDHHYENFDIIQ